MSCTLFVCQLKLTYILENIRNVGKDEDLEDVYY